MLHTYRNKCFTQDIRSDPFRWLLFGGVCVVTVIFSESAVVRSISSANGTVLEYRVSLQSRPVLEDLSNRARLGLIVNSRNQSRDALREAMKKSGLLSFFDSDLVIFYDEVTRNALTKARAMLSETAFFVDEDCSQRVQALKVGFAAAIPHPLLASEVLEGTRLIYVRVSRIESERLLGTLTALRIACFHVTTDHQGSAYLITTPGIAEKIRAAGLAVKIFDERHDPQLTDPYLVSDDRPVPADTSKEKYATDFLEAQGKAGFIVDAMDRSLLLALTEDVPVESIHFPIVRHGHNRRLLVNTEMLRSFRGTFFRMQTESRPNVASDLRLNKDHVAELNEIDAERMKQLHEPYIGAAELPSSGIYVESRHVSHDHNEAVTRALCRHLNEIGKGQMTPALRDDFYLKGKLLSNVIADLPGNLGNSWVIVSAHLDATARKDGVDNPAPGADDDASGIAGVLATAQVAVKLRRAGEQFKHGLRFIFFNAEEDYILGSDEYVRDLKPEVNIVGVFQMDMIGFTGGALLREFEVHTGCGGNLEAEVKALELARTIQDVRGQVSKVLNRPQIYPSFKGGFDPNFGRSDHSPFQKRGYAACMICEDQNEGPLTTSPPHRENPDYHRRTDKKIDYQYGAEIARVVAAAAILKAKG
jgi:bacterial leucyl aminopeptidase